LRLTNRALKPAAIELVINEFRRDLDGRGIAGRRVEDEFLVYPAQLVLMPGDEASVQLRWVGADPQDRERTYSLTTRELVIPPGALPQPEAAPSPASEGVRINVNVLVNYDVRIYVRPRGARPRVVVEEVTVRPQSASQPELIEVMLANQGSAHQSLREKWLVIVPLGDDGRPLPLPPVTLAARDVQGMNAALLAGDRRLLRIPRPVELPAGPVRVLLSD
jgi:fimbrial chaperone protein